MCLNLMTRVYGFTRVHAGLRRFRRVYGLTRVYGFTRVYRFAGLRDVYDLRRVVVLSCLRHQEGIVSHLCRTFLAISISEFLLSLLYGVMADNPSKD